MTIEERLSYCNICSNRSKNGEFTICKLTANNPEFKDYCENFKIDQNELNNLKNEINKAYKSTNSRIQKLLTNKPTVYNTESFVKSSDFSTLSGSEFIFFKSKLNYYYILATAFIAITVMYLYNLDNQVSHILYFFIIAILSFITFYYIRKKFKPFIIFNKDGILHKKSLTSWHIILTTHISEKLDEGFCIRKLIIHKHEEYEETKIDISDLKISTVQFSIMLETFKRKYKRNNG